MASNRLPLAPAVGAALLVAVPLILPDWMKFLVTLAMAKFMAVLAVALFLRANQVTFGHAMFYAVGAYTVGFGVKWFGLRDMVLLVPLGFFSLPVGRRKGGDIRKRCCASWRWYDGGDPACVRSFGDACPNALV